MTEINQDKRYKYIFDEILTMTASSLSITMM